MIHFQLCYQNPMKKAKVTGHQDEVHVERVKRSSFCEIVFISENRNIDGLYVLFFMAPSVIYHCFITV